MSFISWRRDTKHTHQQNPKWTGIEVMGELEPDGRMLIAAVYNLGVQLEGRDGWLRRSGRTGESNSWTQFIDFASRSSSKNQQRFLV